MEYIHRSLEKLTENKVFNYFVEELKKYVRGKSDESVNCKSV